jgi:hypothetical protein
LRGFDQERSRQRRAVGIQHHGGLVTEHKQMPDGAEEAFAEIGQPGLDQADPAGKDLLEKSDRVGWSEGHIPAQIGGGRSREQIAGDVLEKDGVECGGFCEAQRRHQASLGSTWQRGLGHHGNAAGRQRRAANREGFAHVILWSCW